MTPAQRFGWDSGIGRDRRPRDVRIRELWDIVKESERRVPTECPYCMHTGIVLHGTTNKGTVRYKCARCAKTFTSGGLTSGSKLTEDQWLQFICCYVDGDSARVTASKVGVSSTTIYRMKERLEEFCDGENSRKMRASCPADFARA